MARAEGGRTAWRLATGSQLSAEVEVVALAETGVEGAEQILERRRLSGQLRLTVAEVTVCST